MGQEGMLRNHAVVHNSYKKSNKGVIDYRIQWLSLPFISISMILQRV